MTGAGAHNCRGQFMQRLWTKQELDLDPHINFLEIRAAKEAAIKLSKPGDYIRLHIDNKVAVCYIHKQGGTRSSLLSEEACSLWDYLDTKKCLILTPHWISTQENTGADLLSRNKLDVWEISLDQTVFLSIVNHFQVSPSLDAFASKLNHKLPRYMTWFTDPKAVGRNAL